MRKECHSGTVHFCYSKNIASKCVHCTPCEMIWDHPCQLTKSLWEKFPFVRIVQLRFGEIGDFVSSAALEVCNKFKYTQLTGQISFFRSINVPFECLSPVLSATEQHKRKRQRHTVNWDEVGRTHSIVFVVCFSINWVCVLLVCALCCPLLCSSLYAIFELICSKQCHALIE